MDTWKQYSGMWPLQTQMQAAAASNWPGASLALYSWGRGDTGNLAQGNQISFSYPTQVGNLNNWKQTNSSENYFSLAVKNDGTLWAWGYNVNGQLGLNDRVTRSSPVQIGSLTNWETSHASATACFAIKTDKTLWSWGPSLYGESGQNDSVYRSSPVQIGALTNWQSIGGSTTSIFAIKTDNTLWSWGRNEYGQLGKNDLVDRSSPVQVGALTDWSAIGSSSTSPAVVVIKTNNTLWSWGNNASGELGQNNKVYRSSPVQVGALTDWSTISNKSENCFLATKTNNTLWSWGNNVYGRLGQNDEVYRSSPTQVGALTTWKTVNGGGNASFAIKTDGTLWSWGYNNFGQLGQNNLVNRSSPVQIGSSSNWNNVSGAPEYVMALYKA